MRFAKRWVKYNMRVAEIIQPTKSIQPKPPKTPEQARLHALKQGVKRSRDQLRAEQDRQRQQRETERKRREQQRSL